jgi:hypothetical protein
MSEKLEKSMKKVEVTFVILFAGSITALIALGAVQGQNPVESMGPFLSVALVTVWSIWGAAKIADIYVEKTFHRKKARAEAKEAGKLND